MAFDEKLADRLQALVEDWPGISQKKMFGGIGFLLNGNMCLGVYKDYLILRVGTDVAESLISEEYVKPFDITGQVMKGWVMVESEGYKSDRNMQRFVQFAGNFVKTLPPK